MPVVTSLLMGGIQPGEISMVTLPAKIRKDAYPTLFLHGAGATNANFLTGGYAQCAIQQIASRALGSPTLAGLMGGDVFANDTGMARITAATAYLNTLLSANYQKFHLIGVSMGGAMALRWAAQNPTKVASITGFIPLTDIITAYNTDAGGLRASIGTAWGVTYPTPLPAGADLEAQASIISDAKIPTQFLYANNDTIIPPAETLQMASLIKGAVTYDVGPFGHSEISILSGIQSIGKGDGRIVSDFVKAAQNV